MAGVGAGVVSIIVGSGVGGSVGKIGQYSYKGSSNSIYKKEKDKREKEQYF